jgi:hypothetical protein
MEIYWMPIPGVAICVLGAAAAIMTWRAEKKPGIREKTLWTILIFVLMAVEIVAITHDRREQDTNHLAELTKQQGQFDQTMRKFTELQALILSSNKAQAQVVKNASLPELSLKKRAADLSAKIFSFLTDRKVNEPLTPLPRTREEAAGHFDALVRYGNQTMALYKETFQSKVVAIHDEFARMGIRSAQLDQFYQVPTNQFGIEYVASGIGALAEGLKN